MMTVVPFEPWHVVEIQKVQALPHIGLNVMEYANSLYRPGMAFTGLLDGKPVGAAGVVKLWPGVGEAWAMVTDLVRKYPFFMHRSVKRGLLRIAKEQEFHRLQIVVADGFGAGCQWAERLGFLSEGVRRQYDPDKRDYLEYAMIF